MHTTEKNQQFILKEDQLVATSARNAEKINSILWTLEDMISQISDRDLIDFLKESMRNGAASSLSGRELHSLYANMEIILNILSEGVETLHYQELASDDVNSICLQKLEEVRYEAA